eukprot:m.303806 g.303806  ORF g.303806 m.303806 type:complete len:303 (+) comp16234_c0_seq1:22-930(+)
MSDSAVIATNDDATNSKRSAVLLGYYQDEFIKHFCGDFPKERKPPLINRGYFARVVTFRNFVQRFLDAVGPAGQIVSLGAGYDTLFFRLMRDRVPLAGYFEVDFPEVMQQKRLIVQHSRSFQPIMKEFGALYHPVPADLRNTAALEAALVEAGLDKSRPTLFMSECVLIYMPPETAASLLQWTATFPCAFYVNYEMVNPHDAFGQVMLRNLQSRGCALLGLAACPTVDAQIQRYLAAGWQQASAADMGAVYRSIPSEERQRIERIEFMDEFEEWDLINQHYCMSWAWNSTADVDLSPVAALT